MKIFLFSILLLFPFAADAAPKHKEAHIEKRRAPSDAGRPLILTQDKPNFCLMGGQSGKPYQSEAAFNSIVWRNDVVYVGETHDEPLDHMAQFEALKAMRTARGSKIGVGFEMLNAGLQPVLDEYAAGGITEEEFLSRADWKKGKGFNYDLYKPLFDFIRERKLRAIALNVPKTVIHKIARAGLESLTPEEKRSLPENLAITKHKKYNEYLKESFSAHGSSSAVKDFSFSNYQASMAAWNEGMGSRIAAFLARNPGYSVLVIAGNGHIIYNAAIPASVKARVKDVRQASFYTETAAKCPDIMPKEHKDMANYIWYINHAPRPEPAVIKSTATPATLTLSTTFTAPGAAAKPGR